MSFDDAILRFTMPTLCGIKPSCLFSMKKSDDLLAEKKAKSVGKAFKTEGKKITAIVKEDGHALYFVYDEKALAELCVKKQSCIYLKKKGYPVERGQEFILAELFSRLKNRRDFPHEVGLFLGYPLSDVIQFEKYKGEHFTYCGFWKVYGNADKAISLMQKYKDCSSFCKLRLEEGNTILETVSKYKKTYGGLNEKGNCLQHNNW